MGRLPHVCIVSPALATANDGNAHTAARWQRFLQPVARPEVVLEWRHDAAQGNADVLIALHARRSAASILRFHAAHPERALAVVLTGTDLYRDLDSSPEARQALGCASHIVVLQQMALRRLQLDALPKTRVIVQSAPRRLQRAPVGTAVELVAVGHLRPEKDPLTLMRAVRSLPADAPILITHIGRALDAALCAEAVRTQHACPRYRWLGDRPHRAARSAIARSHALVHTSTIEGGANVVIEAVRSGVPVLASRIDGNIGLLGLDYAGCFDAGDAAALAGLMQRFAGEPAFAARLQTQCALRAPLFAPAVERVAVRGLLRDLLANLPARQSLLRRCRRIVSHEPLERI